MEALRKERHGFSFIKVWKLMKVFTVYYRDLAVGKSVTAKDLALI